MCAFRAQCAREVCTFLSAETWQDWEPEGLTTETPGPSFPAEEAAGAQSRVSHRGPAASWGRAPVLALAAVRTWQPEQQKPI